MRKIRISPSPLRRGECHEQAEQKKTRDSSFYFMREEDIMPLFDNENRILQIETEKEEIFHWNGSLVLMGRSVVICMENS